MDFSNINFRPYKYKVDRLDLTIENYGEFKVEPRLVNSIKIEKDYDNYVFPYLELQIMIPNAVFRAMQKSNIECHAYLNIKGGYGSADYADGESDDNIVWKDYINQTLYMLSDSSSTDPLESTYDEIEKENGVYGENSVSDMCTTYILLYNEEYLFGARKTINAVLNNCDLMDAATFICQKCGLKKILASPAFNNKKYTQLILPPLTAVENLDYICNNYALHQCGTVIFFDWNRGYIIDKNSVCTAWTPNESKEIYITSYNMNSTRTSFVGGCAYTDGVSVINLRTGSINFSVPSVVNDQSIGTNIVMIDSKSGSINKRNSNAKISSASNGGTSTVLVTNSGEDTSKAVAQTLREASREASVNMEAVDLDMLLPNKEFNISMDDASLSQYMGKYRCTKFIALLTRDGDTMSNSVQATFKGYE